MEILLDGRAYPAVFSGPTLTVGDLLIDMDQRLQSEGRAMQRVELNGVDLAADQLTMDVANTPASGIRSLRVASASVAELVLEAIDEVEAVLPELPVACQALATVFAGDEPAEGLAPLGDLLQIWEGLRESRLRVAGALNLSLATLEIANGTAAAYEEALEALIVKVHETVEKRDFKAAADLIAYDLNDFAEREPAIFARLRERCVPRGAK